MNIRLFLYSVLVFTAGVIGFTSSVSAEAKLVSQNKNWSAYYDDQNCWLSSVPIKSIATRNGQSVRVERTESVSIGATRLIKPDGTLSRLWFSYIPGHTLAPSKSVKMLVDGQPFYLTKINTREDRVFALSPDQNMQILISLMRGLNAEIISETDRGITVIDTFSLMGFTASVQASTNECKTRSEKQVNIDTKAHTPSQKRATGGGEVRVMEVVATNRKSRGKLDACEISYILAFEDYIYLDGGITFLRGSLSLAGFTNDADREPAFLFKITAFDLLAEGHKLAPLEYAYLSTDNISYAGKESTIIDASDGGLVVAYDVSNSSLNFTEPLTLNIMRKDGRSDVAVPVNFMEADLNAGVSYAACMLSLLEVLTNKFN